MPRNKAKGSNIERELFQLFVAKGYRAIRAAGSGTMENADCDIIAGKKGKGKYAIEVKSSKKPYKYISKEQMEKFLIFSIIKFHLYLYWPIDRRFHFLDGRCDP